MHIIVTGANGFIGKSLVSELLKLDNPLFNKAPLSRLTLIDLDFDSESPEEGSLIHLIKGSFSDLSLLEQAIAKEKADLVFHLASVPSGLSESNHDLGMEVNVQGVINLLDLLHKQENKPRLVFASSIAVYGKPEFSHVDEETLPTPGLSYGYQKLVGENLVADYSRRGWIDGCSLRLPGIVARPPEPNGAISIFYSDLIRELSAGRPFTCPVSANAHSWLMSVKCCVNNLINAALTDFNKRRIFALPALHCSIGEIVNAIGAITGNSNIQELITFDPDPWVEENFGSYPPLFCPEAEALGFSSDGDLESLVKNSL